MIPTGAELSQGMEFVTRRRESDDDRYIRSSYLSSYHKVPPMQMVRFQLYTPNQTKVLEFLLRTASVIVACFPESPNDIVGYAIHQHLHGALILHYLHTRIHGVGIGRKLVQTVAGDAKLVIATHPFRKYRSLRSKVAPLQVEFDPYLLPRLMSHGQT